MGNYIPRFPLCCFLRQNPASIDPTFSGHLGGQGEANREHGDQPGQKCKAKAKPKPKATAEKEGKVPKVKTAGQEAKAVLGIYFNWY